MKIIIMNGSGGSGKDTFYKLCRENFRKMLNSEQYIGKTSIIDPIKEIAEQVWEGGKSSKERKFLSDLKILCENFNDFPMQETIKLVEEIKKYTSICSDYAILFIDMREAKDIKRFCSLYPDTKKLLISRGEITTYGNTADDNVYNSDVDYDYEIDNNGTIKELDEKAWFLINELLEEIKEEGEL